MNRRGTEINVSDERIARNQIAEAGPVLWSGPGMTALLILLVLILAPVSAGADDSVVSLPELSGPYLGQPAPGLKAALFAPGFISTCLHTRDLTITADGKEVCFTIFSGNGAWIMGTRQVDGVWTEPAAIFPPDKYAYAEPALSADGQQIMFLSNRPLDGGDPRGWQYQSIWAADRQGDKWGEPYLLDFPGNDMDHIAYYPSLTRDGTLYYTVQAEDRSTAVFRTHLVDGVYGEPEKLGEGVNSTESQYNACIDPDETFLVFLSRGRPDATGRGDYYVSYRLADGSFGEAIHLDEEVNQALSNGSAPSISADGKYLFFSSDRSTPAGEDEPDFTYDILQSKHSNLLNGASNIYWIDVAYLEQQRLRQEGFPHLTGDYVGQPLPGEKAELFGPGVITTGLNTRDVAMTPEGDELYFCVNAPDFSYCAILVTKRINDCWTRPVVAPFSTDPGTSEVEPFISPDGQKFYFISSRPESISGEAEDNFDVWVMDRTEQGWGEPYNLGEPVNTAAQEFFPSVTRDGTIYFTRQALEGRGNKIYRSRLVNGKYEEAEELGPEVNSTGGQFNAFIAPDESYLILCTVRPGDTRGSVDYYVCFRDEQDNWTEPINMGDEVNSRAGREYSPYVSPDGEYFFFMSTRPSEVTSAGSDKLTLGSLLLRNGKPENGNSDIYWMKADFIEKLRP